MKHYHESTTVYNYYVLQQVPSRMKKNRSFTSRGNKSCEEEKILFLFPVSKPLMKKSTTMRENKCKRKLRNQQRWRKRKDHETQDVRKTNWPVVWLLPLLFLILYYPVVLSLPLCISICPVKLYTLLLTISFLDYLTQENLSLLHSWTL